MQVHKGCSGIPLYSRKRGTLEEQVWIAGIVPLALLGEQVWIAGFVPLALSSDMFKKNIRK